MLLRAPQRRWVITVVLLLIAMIASGGCRNSPETAESSGGSVPESPATDIALDTSTTPDCDLHKRWDATDALVFVDADLDDAAIQALETELTEHPGIVLVGFTDQQQAFRDFQEMFEDSPAMLDAVTVVDMPMSFGIQLLEPAEPNLETLNQRYASDDRIFAIASKTSVCPLTDAQTLSLCQHPASTAMVFMNPEASGPEIDAVAAMLSGSDLVETVVYTDQAATLEEFGEMFPDLRSNAAIGLQDMPSGFTITGSHVDLAPLLDELATNPTVFEVIRPNC